MNTAARELSALIEQLEETSKWVRYDRPSQWSGPGAEQFSLALAECGIHVDRALTAAYEALETAKAVALQLQEVVVAMGTGQLQEWVA